MDARLEKNPTWMTVVAAAIGDGSGRWLMHRRPPGKQHEGLWEFPGGKVESGESPRIALVREIDEELGLTLDAATLKSAAFAESEASEGRPPIVILLYTVPAADGIPQALEGGEIGWFAPEEIAALDMPPLDVELSRKLFAKAPGSG